jgi:hypothetical protein
MGMATEPKVACVMMAKDEESLLAPWLAYHGYLFGFPNIWVFDNGSTSPSVKATLIAFESAGVNVIRSKTSRDDYLAKGLIIGEQIRRLDMSGHYDFLFPSDCDEFVALHTNRGFTCDRAAILNYLTTLMGEKRALRIPFQLANNPYEPDHYVWFEFYKTFFAKDTFAGLDHGHHNGKSNKSSEHHDTDIVHVHYHYQLFSSIKAASEKKWIGDEPLGQIKSLEDYNGPYKHLVGNYFMKEDRYVRQFFHSVQIYFPEFRKIMDALGQPFHFPEATPAGSSNRVHAGGQRLASASAFDLEGRDETTLMMPPGAAHSLPRQVVLDRAYYLDRNPDVARAKISPIHHFCRFGFKEGRLPSG